MYLKKPVDWKKEVHEIIDIVDDAVDKMPAKVPTYDLTGPVEKPKKRRRLLNWLRRR
jgi:hypothetical protein